MYRLQTDRSGFGSATTIGYWGTPGTWPMTRETLSGGSDKYDIVIKEEKNKSQD